MSGYVLVHSEPEPRLSEAHGSLTVLKVRDAANPQVEIVLRPKMVSLGDATELVEVVR